jgi:hypothetical protein
MIYGLLNIFVWNVTTPYKNHVWTFLEFKIYDKV